MQEAIFIIDVVINYLIIMVSNFNKRLNRHIFTLSKAAISENNK